MHKQEAVTHQMEGFVVHPARELLSEDAATALFYVLLSNWDRAMGSFYRSCRVRASELLGLRCGGHGTRAATGRCAPLISIHWGRFSTVQLLR